MHTVKVILVGLALLALCLLVSRLLGGVNVPWIARAAKAFIPLWFVGAGVNMYIGVSKAGYSVADELPIFGVVFAIPAAIAAALWWFNTRSH
jgi:hypothetical protein